MAPVPLAEDPHTLRREPREQIAPALEELHPAGRRSIWVDMDCSDAVDMKARLAGRDTDTARPERVRSTLRRFFGVGLREKIEMALAA